jgi:hypothetical protein
VVVIADPRVVTKAYGRALIEGLPPARRLVGAWAELLPAIREFYSTPAVAVRRVGTSLGVRAANIHST